MCGNTFLLVLLPTERDREKGRERERARPSTYNLRCHISLFHHHHGHIISMIMVIPANTQTSKQPCLVFHPCHPCIIYRRQQPDRDPTPISSRLFTKPMCARTMIHPSINYENHVNYQETWDRMDNWITAIASYDWSDGL